MELGFFPANFVFVSMCGDEFCRRVTALLFVLLLCCCWCRFGGVLPSVFCLSEFRVGSCYILGLCPVPLVFAACFFVILQRFFVYCCNLFSVCLLVVVAVILTAFIRILFCSWEFRTGADSPLVLGFFAVVTLLVFVVFLLGLALVH